MARAKFDPRVYAALRDAHGLSNRQIGRMLGVSEASVRRGLSSPAAEERSIRQILNDLADRLERAGL